MRESDREKAKRTRVECTINVGNVQPLSESFDKGVLRICYPGENVNRFRISKETLEKYAPTMINKPVVCRYNPITKEIGEHDVKYVMTGGEWKKIYITEPVGVVPESTNIRWETVEDSDGTREYLCCDVLLWKRQEAYQKLKDNGTTSQSMEMDILRSEFVDGYETVYEFEFTAFCLLGEGIEPCFESAALVMFSKNEFAARYAELLNDLSKDSVDIGGGSESGAAESESSGGAAVTGTALFTKGGVQKMGKNIKGAQFSLTAAQEREELERAVCRSATFIDEWDGSEICRYCYLDHDSGKHEVYCFDREDGVTVALNYAFAGDVVTVDAASARRVKIAFEPLETVSETPETTPDENLVNEAGEFALRGERHRVQRAESEKAIFAKFDNISETEELAQLKEHSAEFPLAELEEKCFAIVGKVMTARATAAAAEPEKAVFAARPAAHKQMVTRREPAKTEAPYGGLFEKYGNR